MLMASYATYTLILFSVTLSFFKSEITLAIFGLDNAGKTTTVNSIRGGMSTFHSKMSLQLANKKDLLESMTEAEVIEALNLEVLVNAYQCPCRVECCSAIKGTGRHTDKAIKLGLRWILSLIESELVSLRARVSADMQEQANADAKEREKRKQRVKKAREERNRLETKLAASLQEATADATSSMGPAKIAAERSFNIIGDSTTASVSGEDGISIIISFLAAGTNITATSATNILTLIIIIRSATL
ncbi:ADP-ribosylation factor-like protein 13B [Sparganum proliferum]